MVKEKQEKVNEIIHNVFEFLMLYGWVILLVAVIVGCVIYYIPDNHYKNVVEMCRGECKDVGFDTASDCDNTGDDIIAVCKKKSSFCNNALEDVNITRCIDYIDYKNLTFEKTILIR